MSGTPCLKAGACEQLQDEGEKPLPTNKPTRKGLTDQSKATSTRYSPLVGRPLVDQQARMHDEVQATTLLDRLFHHALVITINEKSYYMQDWIITEKQSTSSH